MRRMMPSGSVCALVAALLVPPFAPDAFPSVPDGTGEECLVEQSFDTWSGYFSAVIRCGRTAMWNTTPATFWESPMTIPRMKS